MGELINTFDGQPSCSTIQDSKSSSHPVGNLNCQKAAQMENQKVKSGQVDDQKPRPRDDCLPITKIRTIMKSSPDIELVSQECLPIVCRATEMFIQHFITQAYIHSKNKKSIEYADIAEAVDNEENLSFLGDILPRKRLAGECIDLSKKKTPTPPKSEPEPQR